MEAIFVTDCVSKFIRSNFVKAAHPLNRPLISSTVLVLKPDTFIERRAASPLNMLFIAVIFETSIPSNEMSLQFVSPENKRLPSFVRYVVVALDHQFKVPSKSIQP